MSKGHSGCAGIPINTDKKTTAGSRDRHWATTRADVEGQEVRMPVRSDGAGAQHSAMGKSMVCPAEGLSQSQRWISRQQEVADGEKS